MPFKKGQSGNPKGRPPHPYNVLLTEALEAEGKKKRLPPMKRIAKLFYSDDTAALKILKTLVPELKNIETKIDTDSPYRLILEYAPTGKTPKTDKQGKQSRDSNSVLGSGRAGGGCTAASLAAAAHRVCRPLVEHRPGKPSKVDKLPEDAYDEGLMTHETIPPLAKVDKPRSDTQPGTKGH